MDMQGLFSAFTSMAAWLRRSAQGCEQEICSSYANGYETPP
jgi:hypothetical protein